MNAPDFVDGSWLLADDADTQSGNSLQFLENVDKTQPLPTHNSPSSIHEALLCWLDENP
jgi:hypothetical protein